MQIQLNQLKECFFKKELGKVQTLKTFDSFDDYIYSGNN